MHEISKYLKTIIKNKFSNELKIINKMPINPDNNIIILEILKNIKLAHDTWNRIRSNIIIEEVDEPTVYQNIDHSYIPTNVKEYLKTHRLISKKCIFNINKQLMKINISYMHSNTETQYQPISKNKLDMFFIERLKLIYIWLFISNKYKDTNCSNVLNIHLYLTDLYKILPIKGEPLDEININTALTTGCVKNGEINIYREEEWFKVLIHETFHVMGMDFTNRVHSKNNYEKTVDEEILNFISIRTDLRFFETYCELNACWLNLLFYTYFTSTIFTDEYLLKKFHKNLIYEKMFSLIQCEKILNHYDISYLDIFNKDTLNVSNINNKYKEHTYSLSYHILKSIYIFNIDKIFEWFINNNNTGLRFVLTDTNIDIYLNILKNNYNNPTYLSLLDKIKKWFLLNKENNSIEFKTGRMTLFEI
jgi:hypothetical protein